MSLAIALPDETKILDIFRYCQKSFARYGVQLSFPAGTEPCKTYKWRYLEGFIEHMEKLGLSIQTSYKLIDAMVDHAHTHKQLRHRNLAILASASLLSIGCRAIAKEDKNHKDIVEVLKQDVEFVDSQGDDRLAVLMHRQNRTTAPDIVKWHMQGKISTGFLAISRACRVAMSRLTERERAMLPNIAELHDIQRRCVATVALKYRLKAVMDNDWGITC